MFLDSCAQSEILGNELYIFFNPTVAEAETRTLHLCKSHTTLLTHQQFLQLLLLFSPTPSGLWVGGWLAFLLLFLFDWGFGFGCLFCFVFETWFLCNPGWNLLWRPGWPTSHRSPCLCLCAGIKGVCHLSPYYLQPLLFTFWDRFSILLRIALNFESSCLNLPTS